jgi:hypothetical protein
MTEGVLEYDLEHGYVHNWLVVGPEAIPIEPPSRGDPEHLQAMVERYGGLKPEVTGPPMEPATTEESIVMVGAFEGRWHYVRALEDHLLDLSDEVAPGHYLRAWAYTEIESATAGEATLTLTATGPVDLWWNGDLVAQRHELDSGRRTATVEVTLTEGRNQVLIELMAVAVDLVPYACALRLQAADGADLKVMVPTRVEPVDLRRTYEEIFNAAYMDRDVLTRAERLAVHWPEAESGTPAEPPRDLLVRVQTPDGRVYADAERTGGADVHAEVLPAYKYPLGQLEARLMPRPQTYYEANVRVSRTLRFWGLDNETYTETPTGTFQERRQAILLSAARRERGLYSEIAKMAIGWWDRMELDELQTTLNELARQPRPYGELIGALGLVARFGEADTFPTLLLDPLQTAALTIDYDAVGESEADELLAAACEILAGQRYPDATFQISGQTGAWHRARGERRALDWMATHGARGLRAGASDLVIEAALLALIHLVEHADTEEVWQLAAVLIDKLLFTIGVHTYQGVFGAARGSTSTESVLGGYLAATAGIAKLLWGTGVLNQWIRTPVSFALASVYELPVLLQQVAADLPAAGMWSREHHEPEDGESFDAVAYKTPDTMLAAAPDYWPGTPGDAEHVWQATLGPGATVFVNHPGTASLSNAHRPNLWRGNGVLPRVAQWHDALIALYRVPEDDWMGYTHAYFPIHAFDAYEIHERWAFAQKGEGYLALTAAEGFELITTGPTADRELRSYGAENVWLCQMGRASQDGDFAAFRRKVQALPITFEGLAVTWTTLRDDDLALGWDGPFRRNGEAVELRTDHHIENAYSVTPFPARRMEIGYRGTIMQLDFES